MREIVLGEKKKDLKRAAEYNRLRNKCEDMLSAKIPKLGAKERMNVLSIPRE